MKEHGKKIEDRESSKSLVGTRGRIFEGLVVKKFGNRAVIDFERTVRVPKYERFYRKKTRLHAKIPENLEVNIGDYIKVRECRPLSKIIHFVVVEVVRRKE